MKYPEIYLIIFVASSLTKVDNVNIKRSQGIEREREKREREREREKER